jgi:hypothetical protein
LFFDCEADGRQGEPYAGRMFLRTGTGRLVAVLAAGLLALLASGPAAAQTAPGKIWVPNQGVSWQWQLSGKIDTSVKAHVYDIDSEVSKKTVRTLHAKGRRVICYISAGSWENFRPDAAKFPASVKGKTLDGWPDERWLDIRQVATLRPIMAARMDVCRAKGFDGVEPDNVDGYTNDSGFPLTAAEQRTYNLMLASLAHARGLSVGLKNDIDQAKALQPFFDFAVNEQCRQYRECGRLKPFLGAGKAVFHAEYDLTRAQFCPQSKALGLSSIRKKLNLGVWRRAC